LLVVGFVVVQPLPTFILVLPLLILAVDLVVAASR
jgi:hypothetical protein